MLKKTITYTNLFTDQEVTEEHYFHISKADLVEMEMEEHKEVYTNKNGEKLTGMQAQLSRIVEAEDGKAIMAAFKDFIRRAYGRKDGDRFRKSREIWEEFESSEAFSSLLYELCTNANAASEFVNGIVPKDLEQEAAKLAAQTIADQPEKPLAAKVDSIGASTAEIVPRFLTRAEMEEMEADELQSGLAAGRYKLS